MVLRWVVLLMALGAMGCDGGVIFADAGADAGSSMDGGTVIRMDGMMPPPRDGMMPPPRDGMMPPPPDGMPPPPPDGMPPPPPDGMMPPPREDAGTCDLTPPAMRCCFDDADCPLGPGGMPLRCYGPTCAPGGEGQCAPPAPPGRCFGDLDCPSGQSCSGGSLGCAMCSDLGCPPPTLGTCVG